MKLTIQQLDRIADRWIAVLDKYGSRARHEHTERHILKAKLAAWNVREPLSFDMLEQFDDVDFTHDLGGIMRDDYLMSARCAAVYHTTS